MRAASRSVFRHDRKQSNYVELSSNAMQGKKAILATAPGHHRPRLKHLFHHPIHKSKSFAIHHSLESRSTQRPASTKGTSFPHGSSDTSHPIHKADTSAMMTSWNSFKWQTQRSFVSESEQVHTERPTMIS